MENPKEAVWARVAGDVLDLAALGSGFTRDNPKKENLAFAFATVAGITALDYWCASRLGSARPHVSVATHRANVSDGSAPHLREEPVRRCGASDPCTDQAGRRLRMVSSSLPLEA